MTAESATAPGLGDRDGIQRLLEMGLLIRAVRNGLLVAVVMAALAILFSSVLDPIIESTQIEQTVMIALSRILIFVLPFLAYMTCGIAVRDLSLVFTDIDIEWKGTARSVEIRLNKE